MNSAEVHAEDVMRFGDGGEVGLVRFHDFVLREPFAFDDGSTINGLNIRYETYGKLNEGRSNAILVCHALTGDHHCAGVHAITDRKQGWWNNMIGPGKPIDTTRFFVICANCVGGCQGTTGPSSLNPETGQPYNMRFPLVSISDMVRAQKRLVEHLEIETLFCVVGGSMGGMQALQWAIDYPDAVRRVLPLATTARQSAQAIAFNEVGRSAILHDPNWMGGDYAAGAGPKVGLSIARMMAHITYLSDRGMEDKFGRERARMSISSKRQEVFDPEYAVESYLHYQGQSFINRFDARTYLYFTKALDHFDLFATGGGDLEEALRPVTAETLVVAFSSDWLFPPQQNRDIVLALMRAGKRASYAEVDAAFGHDSFLVHSPELYALVRAFLQIG